MRRTLTFAAATAAILMASSAMAQDIKIALIAGKTGPLEAYAKQTETGFMMGLEYPTKGTMSWKGRKIDVIVKDDQLKPDLGKTLLEQAYDDDKVDLAIGTTSSAAALAMLPVAEENRKVLIVEPAVADSITGEKWNRYIFRTGRNSSQDASRRRRGHSGNRRRQRRDAGAGLRLRPRRRGGVQGGARRDPPERQGGARGIRAAEHHRLHRSAQRLFDALKDKPGRKIIDDHLGRPAPAAEDRRPEARALRHRDRARRQHPAGDAVYKNFPAWKARSTTTTASRRTR